MSYRNQLGATPLDNLYCDDVYELQRNLKKVGAYFGEVDGDPGSGTWGAINAFAGNHGLTVPVRAASPQVQQPLSAEFCATLKAVADGTYVAPQTGGMRKISGLRPSTAMRLISSSGSTRADEVTSVEAAPSTGWWANQTPTVKYAIIGGGALVVLAAAYYATQG